jgi:uncharacterized RDD family membrane protein YckC
MNIETTERQSDLFTPQDLYRFEEASTGQRFVNLLIDSLTIQWGLAYLTNMVWIKILSGISPEVAYEVQVYGAGRNSGEAILVILLFSYMNYMIYYTCCEKLFRGYTLGKLVSGTRAIREDGEELTFGNALLRSLSRLVPIEAFSGFGGHPWHDTWTKTMVVKTR